MKIIYKDGTTAECPQEQELHVIRHTAAHILAQAVKNLYPQAHFAYGPATEQMIQQATSRLMENTTSFVIAHRLSTIRQADMILVNDRGGIVENGTHDELLALGGAYYNLYTTQLSKQERHAADAASGEAG